MAKRFDRALVNNDILLFGGNGRLTSFLAGYLDWRYCPLKVAFPRLFLLSSSQFSVVVDIEASACVQRRPWYISHLFFADDILLICKSQNSQVIRLMNTVFSDFCSAYGLKVSYDKSRFMFSKNVSRRKRAMFTQFSSIRIASGLGKYLGFPFIQGQVKRADFNFIFDKISRRLVDWKNRLLNKAGKLTLARSVMSTVPIYPMQNYWLPQATCMVIDRVVRNFIWDNRESGNGLHLVKWEIVTCPGCEGGLTS
jgi:hypothetical protein